MKTYLLPIYLLAVCFSTNTFAENQYSSTYKTCISNSGGDMSELSSCKSEELSKQSTRLNNAYAEAMSVLPTAQKSKLRNSQDLWTKYRDADCSLYYSLTGGTIDLVNGADCELSMTYKRVDDIQWLSANGGE